MFTQIVLLLALFAYSFVVSQSFSYIISLRNVLGRLDANSYILMRKLIDENFRAKFKYIFYTTWIFVIALCVVSALEKDFFLFTCSLVALAAYLADTYFMLKGNMPINNIINGWQKDSYPSDWGRYRQLWFNAFTKRQFSNIIGFISLLIAAVFS